MDGNGKFNSLYLQLWARIPNERVNNAVLNAVLGCNLKNDRMILVCFQGKPFSNTAIQVYFPTTDAEEDEVDQFFFK